MRMGAAVRMESQPMSAPLPETAEQIDLIDEFFIDTRFGRIAFKRSKLVAMPIGMLGFGHLRNYGLADLPDPRFSAFKLLQAADDAAVSFVVLPIDPKGGMIDEQDWRSAFAALEVRPEEGLLALVVSPRTEDGQIRFTVNCRAPVIIDTRRLIGWQHVLPNPRYEVRHPL